MTKLSLPKGFVEQRSRSARWWVKVGWESYIPTLVFQSISAEPDQTANAKLRASIPISGGRGGTQRISVGEQDAIIIRRYRRGGFVRYFTREIYWDRPLRPFAELCCTEEARRRGVPTVEVLGACVEWALGPLYRGLLITREAAWFHNLWEWLQTAPSADLRLQAVAVVAQTIAIMHRAGIAHADLNPTNILICADCHPPQALLIDFDRARLFANPVPARLREANLRRLQRFFRNYDVFEERLPSAEFKYFRQMYDAALSLQK